MEKYTLPAARVRARREAFCNRIVYFLFMVEQRSCDGRGGAQRPFGRGNEPKKTGACGQNPLVLTIHTFIYKEMVITEIQKGRVREEYRVFMSHLCCPFYGAVGLCRDTFMLLSSVLPVTYKQIQCHLKHLPTPLPRPLTDYSQRRSDNCL